MTVDLPWELREAIDRCCESVAPPDLARAVADLSARYHAEAPRGHSVPYTRLAALAYVAVRLPATFAATVAALLQVRRERPDWQPRTLLDLGAGPGGGAWAAREVWDSVEQIDAVEADPEMIALGRELLCAAPDAARASVRWVRDDLTAPLALPPHDLVLLSYALADIASPATEAIVDRAWAATAGTLVIVEPGTPAGFDRINRARTRLLGAGGFVTAPCPHEGPCPMANSDWCHFAVRLPRSRSHRLLKAAELGYEDEKFSYLAVSRAPTPRAPNRVIRHPISRPGRIQLALCTPAGLETAVVTRRDREAFRRARKVEWGDEFA